MVQAPAVVFCVDNNLLAARSLIEQSGISIKVISSMADSVVKIASLVQPSPLAIVTAPSVVPVASISSHTFIVLSLVVADSVTAPTSKDSNDTGSVDWDR